VRITLKFNFVRFPTSLGPINIQIRTPQITTSPSSAATSTVLATHECHPLRDTHYSLNSSTAPLPLIPRRLAPLSGSRRLSTLIAPHVDPPSSGVILTRASPPTTPDSSGFASTPVRVLPQTPPSAIEAKLSSTASLPLAPHSSPSESASQPVPPRRVRDQERFPAIRPPEHSTPTLPRQISETTPVLHPKRIRSSYCRAIYSSHISMPSLLLRSRERIPCRDHPGKSRASL